MLIIASGAVPVLVSSPARARQYLRTPLAARFAAKVRKDGPVPQHCPELGPCWLWTGALDSHGYGQIQEGGARGRRLKAHRVAWAIENGPLADEVLVLHRCDNPPCVRGSHLFTGSASDNSRDAAAKGRLVFQMHPERALRGERSSSAKLTAPDVAVLRHLRREEHWTQLALAKRFGVSQAAVSLVLRGKTWR